MLKDVVSISGRQGLFKLISKGKNVFIAESLIDQKRIPVYQRDKTIYLADTTMYTNDGDVRLSQVFRSIKEKENGAMVSLSPTATPAELRDYFALALPEFDRDRVYPSDIKKVINWYNLLIKSGITEFEAAEAAAENSTGENENENTESTNELEKKEEN